MPTVYPYPEGTPSKARFENNSGTALSGGLIYFYEAGTTTAKDTYSDSAGTVANANPVVLNSRGEADIFLQADGDYKVTVRDSAGVLIYTVDNVRASGFNAQSVSQLTEDTSPDAIADFLATYDTSGLAIKKVRPISLAAVSPFGLPVNLALSAAVASSALTMSVNGRNGSDPSASNRVYVPFRSSTAGNGDFNWRSITGTLSLVISSGSTLGHNSALKQYIYWYLIDNSGTVELAASSKFFGLHGIVSTTAEGGAGAADSGTVMYSTTARTNVPFTCVGYTEDTQTTAGTWATAPSTVHLAPFSHPLISFSAHKNGTDQTGIVTSTETKITFGTEIYDNGGLFDAVTNNRWRPPPGHVWMSACLAVTVAVDQTLYVIEIQKNGVLFKQSRAHSSGTGIVVADISIADECNGTDYYEVFILHTAGSDRTVDGPADLTYFMGSWSPQRS